MKADVVEVLTSARIDVDYKRSHSQNKIGAMNAVRTINMIDALLDRLNGGVKCPECGQENCSDKLCKVQP